MSDERRSADADGNPRALYCSRIHATWRMLIVVVCTCSSSCERRVRRAAVSKGRSACGQKSGEFAPARADSPTSPPPASPKGRSAHLPAPSRSRRQPAGSRCACKPASVWKRQLLRHFRMRANARRSFLHVRRQVHQLVHQQHVELRALAALLSDGERSSGF